MIEQSAVTEVFTPREAASFLKVSIGCLAKWRMRDMGPAYIPLSDSRKPKIRYSKEALIAWLNAQQRKVA